jgi:hypothetical protein
MVGIMGKIMEFAKDQYIGIFIPALKIIGNFSLSTPAHISTLIKEGVFDLAIMLLQSSRRSIRMEICWTLSNIAAGSP